MCDEFRLFQRHEVRGDDGNRIHTQRGDLFSQPDGVAGGDFANMRHDGRASGDGFHTGPGDRDFFRFVQDKKLAVGSAAKNAVSGVQLPGNLPR